MILFCREVCIFSQSRWNLQKNKNSTREKFKAKSTEKTFIDLVSDDDSSMEEGTFANDTKTNNLGTLNFEDGEVSNRKFEFPGPPPSAEYFDNYVDSLDEILNTPFPGDQASSKREEIIEAREKLSFLLAMDLPTFFSSDKFDELADCASELQNDSSLSAKELSMINLIQEIPLMRKTFLEAKEVSNEADNFFADLESKIASATSL